MKLYDIWQPGLYVRAIFAELSWTVCENIQIGYKELYFNIFKSNIKSLRDLAARTVRESYL